MLNLHAEKLGNGLWSIQSNAYILSTGKTLEEALNNLKSGVNDYVDEYLASLHEDEQLAIANSL